MNRPAHAGLSEADVSHLVRELFGVSGDASALPGEYDLNFKIEAVSGEAYLLKIARAGTPRAQVEYQNAILAHLRHRAPALGIQTAIPTSDGGTIGILEPKLLGEERFVRLLTFAPGTPMSAFDHHGERLLESLGSRLASIDVGLGGFSHPLSRRPHEWGFLQAAEMQQFLQYVREPARRAIAQRHLERFARDVAPILERVPWSVIHGDANDHNVIVDVAPGRSGDTENVVSTIVDFGDSIYGPTIADLAIAVAYAMLGKADPIAAAAHVIRGYASVRPIGDGELEVLYPLSLTRLAMSVANSANKQRLRPDDPYVVVSEAPAWALLEKLESVDEAGILETFRKACAPVPSLSQTEMLRIRREKLGYNLALSYDSPLTIVRGSGQYLYDADGRRYVDFFNNVAHVGHCHPRVVRAGAEQMAMLNTNTRYLHENLVRYAERLTATLPPQLSVCYFVSSGSEATELALRLARAHTHRRDLIVCDFAYHGNTTTLVEISPYKTEGPGGTGLPDWVHKVPIPDDYRGEFERSDPDAGVQFASQIEPVIARIDAMKRGVSAFIIESMPSVGGQVVLPRGYLAEAYRFVRAAGGLCVADEVQTGLGRVGTHFWAFETQDVVPDIVAMGKPIGNGHPLGAVVTTPEIAASFNNGMEYFATFGGNTVSCAIGLAVLDVVADEHLQQHALELGTYLREGLNQLRQRHEIIGDVRGLGLFNGVELVDDRTSLRPAAAQASAVVNKLRYRGILAGTDGPHHNVLKLRGPMVIDRANVETFVEALDAVLHEVGNT